MYPLYTPYKNQALSITENISFFVMHLDCHLTWKLYLDNLVKELNLISFMLRKLLPIINVNMLWMVYLAHFHSLISYGIIFWSSSSSMRNVLIIKKRAIRIKLSLGPRSSCREGFKQLDILTVPCLYIYALTLFTVKNPNIYQTNASVHGRNTRQLNTMHKLSVRLSSLQRGGYYSSVTIFNQLLQTIIKFHNNIHIFKTLLRNYHVIPMRNFFLLITIVS